MTKAIYTKGRDGLDIELTKQPNGVWLLDIFKQVVKCDMTCLTCDEKCFYEIPNVRHEDEDNIAISRTFEEYAILKEGVQNLDAKVEYLDLAGINAVARNNQRLLQGIKDNIDPQTIHRESSRFYDFYIQC